MWTIVTLILILLINDEIKDIRFCKELEKSIHRLNKRIDRLGSQQNNRRVRS